VAVAVLVVLELMERYSMAMVMQAAVVLVLQIQLLELP
jgi:hypothetical protein